MRKYSIHGKELDTSNNLWWYDYGARQYDPTAPRFTTPDPLAEKYYSWNMYGYCMNNPIKHIDIQGEEPVEAVTVAVTTFVMTAGVDFLTNYCSNGYNFSNAMKSVNWKKATIDAIATGGVSVLFSGAATTSMMQKISKMKIGNQAVTEILSSTIENMVSNICGEFLNGKSIKDINFLQIFEESIAGSITSIGPNRNTANSKNKYNKSQTSYNAAKNKFDNNTAAGKNENRIRSDYRKLNNASTTKKTHRKEYIKAIVKSTASNNAGQNAAKYVHK